MARVMERTEQRRLMIETLRKPGGLARADDAARVATRIDRLSRHYPDIRVVSPSALAAQDPTALAEAAVVLEKWILTHDLVPVAYMEGGVSAARAVGRVSIRDMRGRVVGYGTGSMISPDLMLTNHHVFADAAEARPSMIEFNYQDGPDGRPLMVQSFALDPDRFFYSDQRLDIALVAVRGSAAQLAPFGFHRMIADEGKTIIGDFVTIVQHPHGEKKQVGLRENRIVDVLDDFLHYETDTEPGSSGSPVFNDQWEIVALHHASVPAPGHQELGGIINEGIRVSRIVASLRGQRFPAAQQAMVDRMFGERVTIGRGGPSDEAIKIDPDYAQRKGYDPDFLAHSHRVHLPELAPELVPLAAMNRKATTQPAYVLPYHHFSVVMNKRRGLAFFTAVNIDGASSMRLRRDRDHWSFDPRLSEDEQTGEQVYRDNPLDRGHLVRRLDPAWGTTQTMAKRANDDTFHFTNCTPQHQDFNQNQTTWAGLEDYILENADNRDLKVTVFTGPVLADDDDTYRGVQLPRQFWKVVVMVKGSGDLSATGYLLSQQELIDGMEITPEEFSYGAYRTYQVPIRRIEELTRLSFNDIKSADPLGHMEAFGAAREISHFEQLML